MNIKYLTTTIIYLMMAVSGIPQAVAQSSSINPEMEVRTSHYDILHEEESLLNCKCFEVNVEESGLYYAEFWVLPAEYSDGTYTKFSVYVNDVFVGSIIPYRDNWQSARIDGQEKIELQEGNNIITVAVPNPEMPMVEMVKLAYTDTDAVISSSEYEEYCYNASRGISYYIPEEEQVIGYSNILQSNNAPEFAVHHFPNVPLLYTFFTELSFEEGDCIDIFTSSLSEHDLDIIYLGNSGIDRFNPIATDVLPFTPPGQSGKFPFSYTPATSEEMQGLNWKGISLKRTITQSYGIYKTIKIPKSGIYHFRLRHRQSGQTGIANISIISMYHRYTYNEVPISFSYVKCEIPANSKEYGTMTICTNPEQDDPMLYIHGAAADRIVGFGDDASSHMQELYGLSPLDSHVLQQYYVKTSGVSISNVSSIVPESTCLILAGMDESTTYPGAQLSPKPLSNYGDYLLNMKNGSNYVEITESLGQCGVINVISQSEINRIIIMDTTGQIFKTFNGNGLIMSIPRFSLGIKTPGVYIIGVETDKGFASNKIVVK